MGRIFVSVTTFDPFGDVTDYPVEISGPSGTQTQTVSAVGSVVFADLRLGDYQVELQSVPPRCTVDPNPVTATVEFGAATSVAFNVDCAAESAIRVVTQTQGTNLDPNGYTLLGLGDPPFVLAINDTIEVGLPADTWAIELTDVAANCTVAGENPRNVTTNEGETKETLFLVDCAGPPPVACTGATTTIMDATFADADWALQEAYQTDAAVHWGFDSEQTPPGPGGAVPTGNPNPPARWVNLTLSNPGAVNAGVGIASLHGPARVSSPVTSIKVTFDVWATTVRIQAIIKQNNTYYGIPRGETVDQADGWVTIETECTVPAQIAKVGGQTGTGPANPDFSADFEVGYIAQASGTGDNQNRHVIVDNWSVTTWP